MLSTKTSERRQWRRYGVFIVNFEPVTSFSSASVVEIEQINASWKICWFEKRRPELIGVFKIFSAFKFLR